MFQLNQLHILCVSKDCGFSFLFFVANHVVVGNHVVTISKSACNNNNNNLPPKLPTEYNLNMEDNRNGSSLPHDLQRKLVAGINKLSNEDGMKMTMVEFLAQVGVVCRIVSKLTTIAKQNHIAVVHLVYWIMANQHILMWIDLVQVQTLPPARPKPHSGPDSSSIQLRLQWI